MAGSGFVTAKKTRRNRSRIPAYQLRSDRFPRYRETLKSANWVRKRRRSYRNGSKEASINWSKSKWEWRTDLKDDRHARQISYHLSWKWRGHVSVFRKGNLAGSAITAFTISHIALINSKKDMTLSARPTHTPSLSNLNGSGVDKSLGRILIKKKELLRINSITLIIYKYFFYNVLICSGRVRL